MSKDQAAGRRPSPIPQRGLTPPLRKTSTSFLSASARDLTNKKDAFQPLADAHPISLSNDEIKELDRLLTSGPMEQERNSNQVDVTTGVRPTTKEGMSFRFSTPFDTELLDKLISDTAVLTLASNVMEKELEEDDTQDSKEQAQVKMEGGQKAELLTLPMTSLAIEMNADVLNRLEKKREQRRSRFLNKNHDDITDTVLSSGDPTGATPSTLFSMSSSTFSSSSSSSSSSTPASFAPLTEINAEEKSLALSRSYSDAGPSTKDSSFAPHVMATPIASSPSLGSPMPASPRLNLETKPDRPFDSVLDYMCPQTLADYDPDSKELGPVYELSDDGTKMTAATMVKLVSHLADENAADIEFANTFLFTFRRYLTPHQLMICLQKRFFLDPPADAPQEILNAFSNCRKVVMVRVINVLRRWMEEFPFDFTPDILRSFRSFRDAAYEKEQEVRRYISILSKVLRQFDTQQGESTISSSLEEKLNGIAVAMRHPNSTLIKVPSKKSSRFASIKKPKNPTSFLGSEVLEWIILNVLNPATPSSEESDLIVDSLCSTTKIEHARSIVVHMLELGLIQPFGDSSTNASLATSPNSSQGLSSLLSTVSSSSSSSSSQIGSDELNKELLFHPNSSYTLVSTEPSKRFPDCLVADVANFLTFTEHRLFKKINLRELEACAWSSKDKEQKAPNVLKFTLHHRQIAVWVASEIVVAFNQKQRKANIEKFIQICEALRRLNNFNGMMEILGGLSLSKVCKTAWKSVSKKLVQSFQQMEQLFMTSNNFGNYRTELRMIEKASANMPCIPFLGLMLQDVTFIEENPDYKVNAKYPGRKLVNFSKMTLLADVYRLLVRFQTIPIGINENKAWVNIKTLIQSSFIFDEKKIVDLGNQVESGALG